MTDAVLLLGDPRLRAACAAVSDFADPGLAADRARLMRALEEFRAEKGFGRGIAAPQIGIARRLVALDLGEGALCLANPRITWRSEGRFSLWDDCMSFPDLLVRLYRHESVSLAYEDEGGSTRAWPKLERSLAELLQHEIDHLDGILAIDRAEGREGIVYRQAFEANRPYFEAKVDYLIAPTTRP